MLLKQWGNDKDLILKLIPKFLSQTTREMEQLERCLANGQMNEVARLAHAIKGSAGYVGARSIRSLAARLETEAPRGNVELCGELIAEFRTELGRCITAQADLPGATRTTAAQEGSRTCES
jgi:HPt (histidine-containing phosphotransfer) domain-containing protein